MTNEKDKNNLERLCLKAIVDRLGEEGAVIKTTDGQELFWPIACLPDEIGEGDAIKLMLLTDQDSELEREKIAKKILNEILKVK